MADADPDERPLTGTALLERLKDKLASQKRGDPALFRVVEITRDGRGRLVPQGQIWHSNLDHVRRFGRAVAANTASQGVLIADADGAVLEKIPVAPLGTAAGWGGWRDMPLPPAPPRKKPRPPMLRPPVATATPAVAPPPLPTVAPAPPVDLPVAAVEKPFDPESTATLTPAAPPEAEPAKDVELLLP
jgi:hypothetical protein